MKPLGIQSKLVRVFVLQLLLISAATVLGVYGSAKIVEDVLVRQALLGEAEHFWALYDKNSDQALPNTENLLGYLAVEGDDSQVPVDLRERPPGYGRVHVGNNDPIVYIVDRDNARLYLVFDERQVSNLAFYFGIVPLTIVLLILYALTWFTYRQSRRAISPVIKLAKTMQAFNISTGQIGDLDLSAVKDRADADVLVLIQSLERFTERLGRFIERERRFTRDASHELRTPLAVIKGNVDILMRDHPEDSPDGRILLRIKNTINDMEALMETLLMLAREDESSIAAEPVVVNDLLVETVDSLRMALGLQDRDVRQEYRSLLQITAPPRVLAIVFGNLLRNAFHYAPSGTVSIDVGEKYVRVSDRGVGMDSEELKQVFQPFYRANPEKPGGHGLGLAIVQRLCDRFDWKLEVDSRPNEGTRITVHLPDAVVIGSGADT